MATDELALWKAEAYTFYRPAVGCSHDCSVASDPLGGAMECRMLCRIRAGHSGRSLYRSGPLPAREIIFHQAEGQRTCHSRALLENPQPHLRLRLNDHSRLDPGAAEASFMGWSRCRSCYPDYPRPA